jgi:hypothetical protein
MSTKACGIELKGTEAIFVVVELTDTATHTDVAIKKIPLGNTENCADIRSFKEAVETFFMDNSVEKVFIKKRATKGKFAGGSDTFKMEGMIQLIKEVEVNLLPSQTVSAYGKKHEVDYPNTLNKYQHESFLTAVTGLLK